MLRMFLLRYDTQRKQRGHTKGIFQDDGQQRCSTRHRYNTRTTSREVSDLVGPQLDVEVLNPLRHD